MTKKLSVFEKLINHQKRFNLSDNKMAKSIGISRQLWEYYLKNPEKFPPKSKIYDGIFRNFKWLTDDLIEEIKETAND